MPVEGTNKFPISLGFVSKFNVNISINKTQHFGLVENRI